MLPRVLGLRFEVPRRRAFVALARALHRVWFVLPAAQQGLLLPPVPPRLPRGCLPRHDTVHHMQEVSPASPQYNRNIPLPHKLKRQWGFLKKIAYKESPGWIWSMCDNSDNPHILWNYIVFSFKSTYNCYCVFNMWPYYYIANLPGNLQSRTHIVGQCRCLRFIYYLQFLSVEFELNYYRLLNDEIACCRHRGVLSFSESSQWDTETVTKTLYTCSKSEKDGWWWIFSVLLHRYKGFSNRLKLIPRRQVWWLPYTTNWLIIVG